MPAAKKTSVPEAEVRLYHQVIQAGQGDEEDCEREEVTATDRMTRRALT
jgi:hypothetical protein